MRGEAQIKAAAAEAQKAATRTETRIEEEDES